MTNHRQYTPAYVSPAAVTRQMEMGTGVTLTVEGRNVIMSATTAPNLAQVELGMRVCNYPTMVDRWRLRNRIEYDAIMANGLTNMGFMDYMEGIG